MKKFVNLKIACVYIVLIVSMKCIAVFHLIIHTYIFKILWLIIVCLVCVRIYED